QILRTFLLSILLFSLVPGVGGARRKRQNISTYGCRFRSYRREGWNLQNFFCAECEWKEPAVGGAQRKGWSISTSRCPSRSYRLEIWNLQNFFCAGCEWR
ncbi:unnamed protein product, partial [Staurois parvus]